MISHDKLISTAKEILTDEVFQYLLESADFDEILADYFYACDETTATQTYKKLWHQCVLDLKLPSVFKVTKYLSK